MLRLGRFLTIPKPFIIERFLALSFTGTELRRTPSAWKVAYRLQNTYAAVPILQLLIYLDSTALTTNESTAIFASESRATHPLSFRLHFL